MPRIQNLDTENTAPLGSDMGVMVDSPASTAETQKFYWGGMNLLPDASAYNYTIAVSVASNNLTCALKTKAGGNPSATDPVSAWLYGSYYRCTGALSVTANAGSNQFNLGGSLGLYGQTVRMFVYLAYRAASSALVIGFARIPYARIVSDFSTTASDERYCAWSTAPASTDNCFVIGAFSASQGAGASYNWSIPTATNETVVQHPIYVSGRRSYAAQSTGFSTVPATGIYSYMIEYDKITVVVRQVDDNSSVSNAQTFTVSLPMSPPTITNAAWTAPAIVTDSGTVQSSPGVGFVVSAATAITMYKTYAVAANSWTASGEKYCNSLMITYPLKA